MHAKHIIYRDLKPENVMVDEFGYIKLIDFGIAKRLTGDKRTFTTIGTPFYMAPEVILGNGYSFYADLWSLGVLLYEFLFKTLPFGNDMDDPYAIYRMILQLPLKFPKGNVGCEGKKLLEKMLNKRAHLRINGFERFKADSWLDGFD